MPIANPGAADHVERLMDLGLLPAAKTATVNLKSQKVRVATINLTLAQVNAGYELLPAIPGRRYQIIDWYFKMNGAFTGLTAFVMRDQASSPNTIVSIAQADMTDNAVFRRGGLGTQTITDANAAPSNLGVGLGVDLVKTGSDAAGGTAVETVVWYIIQ